jgi:mannose-1-phosphate guanylyltransferase
VKIVLLCGGRGSRLWPLSYPARTIPLFESPDGEHSTIQRLWNQLVRSRLSRFAHVLIGPGQKDILMEQLGESVPFLVEPEGRGTYPAVVYAAACLRSQGESVR